MPVFPARRAARENSGADDRPVAIACHDEILLSGLVPKIERQHQGEHKKRARYPHPENAVPEAERRLADQARDAARLHRPEYIAHALRLNSRRTIETSVAERAQDCL